MRRPLFTLAVPLVVLSLQHPVHAQTNAVAAESLFKEGRELLEKGQLKEACDRFSRSEQLDPAVGTLYNLGDCYEKLGRIASAWGAFRDAARLGRARSDERRATRAEQAAGRLEPRLSRVTITAAGAATPGLVVSRSGVQVDPAALNTPVPVDAGTYTIEVSAPGRKPWTTSGEISEGENLTVPIPELEPVEPATPPPRPPPPPRNTQRNIGIALEIGGGVVLVGGLVFGALAASRWSTVNDACPNGKCASEAVRQANAADADSASTLSMVSTIATIAGVAALAGGLALHLTAPQSRAALAPMVGPSAFGAMLTFRP